MNKTIQFILLTFLVVMQLFQGNVAEADTSYVGDTVVIGIDEWPPYHSKDAKHFGFCTHIITEAFAAVGIRTDITFMPWSRALKESHEGDPINATIWGGYRDWVETHFASDPVCKGEYVLFIQKGHAVDFKKPESFSGLTMGNLIGEGIPDQLKDIVDKGTLKVQSASTVQSIFQMLANDRIDMVAINRTTGLAAMNEYLSKTEKDTIVIHPERFRVSFYRLILGKIYKSESISLLEKFNTGLDILHHNGRIQEIIDAESRGEYEK